MKTKYKIFDGDEYYMDHYECEKDNTPFWIRMTSKYDDTLKEWVQLNKTNNLPDIICTCGNTSFELEYGSYNISAICTKCKRKNSVYSG